jgi:hypothetical protein
MKNENKNTIKLSVNEMQKLYLEEIKRLNFNNLNKIGNRSNNNGSIHKCNYVIYLLDSLDSNTILNVEGCWGDMEIRDFCLCNSGSVVECIVKAILDHNKSNEYCKAWLDNENDAKNGFMAWEIKASLDSHFKCTPAKNGKCTVLINRSGVSIIKASEVSNYTDNKGRLSATGLYGNRNNFMIDFLESALGIQGGYEE